MQRQGALEVFASHEEAHAALCALAESEPVEFLVKAAFQPLCRLERAPPRFDTLEFPRCVTVWAATPGLPEEVDHVAQMKLIDPFDLVFMDWVEREPGKWEPVWTGFKVQADDHDPSVMLRRFGFLKKALLRGATRGARSLRGGETVKHVYISPGARRHYEAGGILDHPAGPGYVRPLDEEVRR
jgi:hypothetical protein